VTTASGPGKVIGTNALLETVMVQLDESQATVELPLHEVAIEEESAAAERQKETKG
jgi:hypothetical protein